MATSFAGPRDGAVLQAPAAPAAHAYVLWHWPRPAVERAEYEGRQRLFHAALAERGPAGLARSTSAALRGAPWANGGGDAYEDRYLIRDAAALDAMDREVGHGALRQAHAWAACVAAGGAAGLYQARLGAPLPVASHALWFSRPAGMGHDALLAAVAPLVRAGQSVLWMRRLALGPTPEFCLESAAPASLPGSLPVPPDALALRLRPIWPA